MVHVHQSGVTGDEAVWLLPLLLMAVVLSAVVSLVGIKLWWFKHRLTFDQNGSRNGAAGGSQPTVVTRQYSSKDKRHSQQFHTSIDVHGVFRRRQEDELEFVRPSALPPVRIRKLSQSTPSLLLLPPAATLQARNRDPDASGSVIVEYSDAMKYANPPTRVPPQPPIAGIREVIVETSTIEEEEAPPFADFAQSFEKANATRSSHSAHNDGEEEQEERQVATTPIAPQRINRSISSDSKGGGQRFLRAKGPSDSSERKRIMERRPTGYLPPNQQDLQAMQQEDMQQAQAATLAAAEVEADAARKKTNRNSGDSYLRYEDIDRDGFDDYRHSWEGAASCVAAKPPSTPPLTAQRGALEVPAIFEMNEAAAAIQPAEVSPEPSPKPLRTAVEDLGAAWVPAPVTSTSSPPTGNDADFAYFIEEKFDQIRHSFQQHEADILETKVTTLMHDDRDELNDMAGTGFAHSQAEPQGYGRSIEEDWESFEQLNRTTTSATSHEEASGDVVLETHETTTTTIRTVERGEYKEVTFDLPEWEEGDTNVEAEPLRPHRRATGYVRDIEELYQELNLQSDEDIDISKLVIESDGSDGSGSRPPTAAVIAIDMPKPKLRQKVTFDFKTEEHFLPSDNDHDKDTDSEGDDISSGEARPEMPKPMKRLTKMRYNEADGDDLENPPALPRTPPPTVVLFGSQPFADESASAANDSWSAIRQHRYLTEEFQQLRPPAIGQEGVAAASASAVKAPFRNPLAQQQPTAGTTDLFVQPRTMRDMKKARQNTSIQLDMDASCSGTET